MSSIFQEFTSLKAMESFKQRPQMYSKHNGGAFRLTSNLFSMLCMLCFKDLAWIVSDWSQLGNTNLQLSITFNSPQSSTWMPRMKRSIKKAYQYKSWFDLLLHRSLIVWLTWLTERNAVFSEMKREMRQPLSLLFLSKFSIFQEVT